MIEDNLRNSRFKALADENRVAILRRLYQEPLTVNELCTSLSLEQSLVSHHLKVLKENRLVKGQREGKSIRYQLAPGLKGSEQELVLELECCRILLRS